MNNKQFFIDTLMSTGRGGMESVISELDDLGFFEAPASTRFHLNVDGGLLQHSVNVYNEAMAIRKVQIEMAPEMEKLLPEDSVAIAALLHDTCKADIYKKVMKTYKDIDGSWTKAPSYDVDYSSFPLGHGEKSVIMLLQCGLDMTDDEIIAIRWHMGAWDLPFQSSEAKGNLNEAKKICPLLTLISAADSLASQILERS